MNTIEQQTYRYQAAEIERLKAQLQAKNQQISLLQAHIDRQQQTIANLIAALTKTPPGGKRE